MTAIATEILFRRDDFAHARASQRSLAPADGEALFAIEHFALTSNNATYAVHGDDLGYWRFYPAAEEGWGIAPVWGFARCLASRAEGVTEGDRFYGFWPMASHALLRPGRITPRGFHDVQPHRAELPAVYNSYERAARSQGDERVYALFRPLFATAFLLADELAERPGLTRAVLSSASSKTALSLAYLLRASGLSVTGLTSPRNLAFVRETGAFDTVESYDDALFADGERVVFVDMAGNPHVRIRTHRALGDALIASIAVGDTHWDSPRAAVHPPGPRSTFFFAPTRAAKRVADWGAAELAERMDSAWASVAQRVASWLRLDEAAGADAVVAAWRAALTGGADPRAGIIRTLATPQA